MTGKPLHKHSEATQVAVLKKQVARADARATAERVRADNAELQVRSLTLEVTRMRNQLAQAGVEIASLKARSPK